MTHDTTSLPNAIEWEAAARMLLAAKCLIEERGWQQSALTTTSEECVATALEHAFQQGDYSIVDFNYAREALARTLKIEREPKKLNNDPLDVPYWGRMLMEWNDTAGRTQQEVLAMFGNAAELSMNLAKSNSQK